MSPNKKTSTKAKCHILPQPRYTLIFKTSTLPTHFFLGLIPFSQDFYKCTVIFQGFPKSRGNPVLKAIGVLIFSKPNILAIYWASSKFVQYLRPREQISHFGGFYLFNVVISLERIQSQATLFPRIWFFINNFVQFRNEFTSWLRLDLVRQFSFVVSAVFLRGTRFWKQK